MIFSKIKSKFNQLVQIIRNHRRRHNFYFQATGSFLILGLVVYLHFMQPPSIEVIGFTFFDKILHFLMFFFTMMWFMYISKKWLVSAVCLIVLGLILEWIQMKYIIDRSFDWFDWIADGTGIVACFLLLPVLIDKIFDSSV